jgi:thioredoxin-like negative regulator of GroEL
VELRIFGKKGCAKCTTTKTKMEHFLKKWNLQDKIRLLFFDLDTVDGRAEGCFLDVTKIPTTILEDSGKPIARWDGEIPESSRIKMYLEELNVKD